MKRYVVFSIAVLFSLLLLMTGCQGRTEAYAGKILPSRIENITDKDIIPEGSEGIGEREYDAASFNPRMFIGRWNLQETKGDAADLQVPAPSGSGTDTWSVKSFPLDIVFGSAVRGGDAEVFRIPFDDVTYMQADYELTALNEESESAGSSVAAAQEAGAPAFAYGSFIQSIVSFLILAWVVFMLVKTMNKLRKQEEPAPEEPTTKVCPFCGSEIPIAAKKCPCCTSDLPEEEPAAEA